MLSLCSLTLAHSLQICNRCEKKRQFASHSRICQPCANQLSEDTRVTPRHPGPAAAALLPVPAVPQLPSLLAAEPAADVPAAHRHIVVARSSAGSQTAVNTQVDVCRGAIQAEGGDLLVQFVFTQLAPLSPRNAQQQTALWQPLLDFLRSIEKDEAAPWTLWLREVDRLARDTLVFNEQLFALLVEKGVHVREALTGDPTMDVDTRPVAPGTPPRYWRLQQRVAEANVESARRSAKAVQTAAAHHQ